MRRTSLAVSGLALATITITILTGCTVSATDTAAPEGADPGATIVVGTTETAVSLDPASSNTVGSTTILGNIFETVLAIPAGGTTPEPELGTCDWSSALVYVCEIEPGHFFSTGREVTGTDVAASMQRNIDIASETGPDYLLANLASVAADGNTVTYTLQAEDVSFPYLLTTLVGRVVDTESMSMTEATTDFETVVGSGPYLVSQYTADEQVVLEPNPEYQGGNVPQNGRVIFQFFQTSETLRQAIAAGTVDVAYRSMSPSDYQALEGTGGVEVLSGDGVEIRQQVWYPNGPSGLGGDLALRQAVAQVIDREAIAELAYADTVTPLYSIVPSGITGHTEAFSDVYGEPDVEAAAEILAEAGIATPVPLTVGYSSQRYGTATDDELLELQRQLDGTGLFEVELVAEEWSVLLQQRGEGAYDMVNLGWYANFPDASQWTVIAANGGYYRNGFGNADLDADHAEALLTTTDPERRAELYADAQNIIAEETSVMPLWQGQTRAVTRDGIEGVQETLDTTFQFRTWAFTKAG